MVFAQKIGRHLIRKMWDCFEQDDNSCNSLVKIKEYQRTSGNIRVKIKDFSNKSDLSREFKSANKKSSRNL